MSFVQPQWDLARTTTDAQVALRELVRTCSMDDVQYQAVVAFETLGKRLLLHPSRFGPAIDALGGRKNEKLVNLGILLGFQGDGLPRTLRNSTGCLSAFNLVVACKTCCDNTEMANILHELMIYLGIYANAPASPYQLVQLLNAISGHGDSLIPVQDFTDLSQEVLSRLTASTELPRLLSALDSKATAAVLGGVFTAVQNQQVDRITLQGCEGGIWLASILLWLDPTMVQVVLKGEILYGDNNRRLCFDLGPGEGWAITEWKEEHKLSELVVSTENDTNIGLPQPFGIFPQRSAKAVLGRGLHPQDVQILGQLAGAFVILAVNRGNLTSRLTGTFEPDKPMAIPESHGSKQLRLVDVCQTDFLSKYESIMQDFGWQTDSTFKDGQTKIVEAISILLNNEQDAIKWINSSGVHSTYLKRLHAVFSHIEAAAYAKDDFLKLLLYNNRYSRVLESAVNIAAEAIYGCLYKPDSMSPLARYMQGYHYKRTMQNAMHVWHLIFKSVTSSYGLSLTSLRKETLKSLLSITDDRAFDEVLIQANNGYVAFLNCLKSPTTRKRDCVAVCAIPGSIRSKTTSTPLSAVHQEYRGNGEQFNRSGSLISSLQIWEGETYRGVEPRPDPDGYEICHQVANSERTLRVVTFMRSRPLDAMFIPLDWLKSIEAVSFAPEILISSILSADAEQNLARALDVGRICWLSAGGSPTPMSYAGYITMTYGSEELRFFTAGRLAKHSLIFATGPLMLSIQAALQFSNTKTRLMGKQRSVGSGNPSKQWVIIS